MYRCRSLPSPVGIARAEDPLLKRVLRQKLADESVHPEWRSRVLAPT